MHPKYSYSFSKHSKNELMHESIRRKQNQHRFRILRKEILEITPLEASTLAMEKFREVDMLLKTLSRNDSERKKCLEILIKDLRDLSCSGLATQIFLNPCNIRLIVQLQNIADEELKLDQYSIQLVHVILLNISGYMDKSAAIDIKELSLRYFDSKRIQTLELLISICSNCLIKDLTSTTIYFLVNTQKVNIYKKLLDLLNSWDGLYEMIEGSILELTRSLLFSTFRFKFQKNCEKEFKRYNAFIYKKIEEKFLDQISRQAFLKKNAKVTKNQYLRTLRYLLKDQSIEFSQELIKMLGSPQIFSPANSEYVQLLASLAFSTTYTLSKQFIILLLQYLFQHLEFAPIAILRALSNSLNNDNTHWKTVYQFFISQAHSNSYPDYLDRQNFPNTAFFVYFLNDVRVQYDICEIIRTIVYSQGGLGILQQCLYQLRKSEWGCKALISFGIQI